MSNTEKIKILKENIKNIIKNSIDIDENYIFNFAKQQAKEMRIEITKGEIKTIINELLIISKNKPKDFLDDELCLYEENSSISYLKEHENYLFLP